MMGKKNIRRRIFFSLSTIGILILSAGCGKKEPAPSTKTQNHNLRMSYTLKRILDGVNISINTGDIDTFNHCAKILTEELIDLTDLKTGILKQKLEQQLMAFRTVTNNMDLGTEIKGQWQKIHKDIKTLFNGIEPREPEPSDKKSEITPFKNRKLGLSLVIPDWLSNHSQQQVGSTTRVSFSSQRHNPDYLLSINVSRMPRISSLKRSFENYLAQLKNQLNTDIDATGFSTVDSIPAYWVDTSKTTQTEGRHAILRQYYFNHKNRCYVIGYGARSIDNFNQVMEKYEQILDGLMIL